MQSKQPRLVEILSDKEIQLRQQHSKRYGFNRVFGPKSSQSDIYSLVVSPLIEKVLNGYSCTVITYGQTATGKTYTVFGDTTNPADFETEVRIQGVSLELKTNTLT